MRARLLSRAEVSMSWNGQIVIDMDAHVVERADRFYQDYIDPDSRTPTEVARRQRAATVSHPTEVAGIPDSLE